MFQSIAGIFIAPHKTWTAALDNVNIYIYMIQAYNDTKNKVKNEDNTHIVNKKTTISNAICLRVQQRLKQSSKRRRLERSLFG